MRTIAIMAALASASLGTPANAQTTVRSESVSYADLDLGSREGQQAFLQRLHIAIARVCGQASNTDLSGANDIRRCHRDLTDQAAALGDDIAARSGQRGVALTLRY